MFFRLFFEIIFMGSTIVYFCNCSQQPKLQPQRSMFISLNDTNKNYASNASYDISFIEQPSSILEKHPFKIPAIRVLREKIKHPTDYNPEEKLQLIFTRKIKPSVLQLKDLKIAKFLGFGSESKVLLVLKPAPPSPEYKMYCLKIIKKLPKMHFEIIKGLSYQACPFLSHTKIVYEGYNYVYFLNEYVSGGKFLDILVKHNMFTETLLAFVMAEVLIAFEYLHNIMGIPCGNLKTNNVHMTSKGHISLTDYGFYRQEAGKPLNNDDIYYAAPEVLAGEPRDFLTDYWSLGIFFAVILTGKFPFSNPENVKVVEKEIKEGTLLIPEKISSIARDLLEKLVKFDRNQRFGRNGVEEVKKHAFFNKVNWQLLKELKLQSPFVPRGKSLVKLSKKSQSEEIKSPEFAVTPNGKKSSLYYTYHEAMK